jgi:hypothetical protein
MPKFKAYVNQTMTYSFDLDELDYTSATRKLSDLVKDENAFFEYLSKIPHQVDSDSIVDTAVYEENN